jgi:hypothetical protein
MSGSALLAKAENLGRRIGKYGFGRDMGCPYFWSPWVNDIYSPDWFIKINARNPWKSVVGELATGKRKFDNWQFLPEAWTYEISPPQICKNFVLLQFFRNIDDGRDQRQDHSDEDFLILNLATKTRHWVATRKLSFDIRYIDFCWVKDNWRDFFLNCTNRSQILFPIYRKYFETNLSILGSYYTGNIFYIFVFVKKFPSICNVI